MIHRHVWTAGLVAVLAAAPAFGETVFKNTASGNPMVKSIEVISFGPNGALLIGDGKGAQVVAVDTGDIKAQPWSASAIEKIDEKLAGKLGTTAKGIKITHLAVNPASGKAYIALSKLDDKSSLIMTVDGTGKIDLFPLDDVKHVRLPLPKDEKAAPNKVTDVAWAGDRVLVAAAANEEFASKVYSIAAPLDAEAKSIVFSTETFHVAHGRWETKAPLSAIIPYEEDGKRYVVGAFACTPLVKYPLDELKSGAHVKGTSVAELGSGNQPLQILAYEKDGKPYLLINTFRFHHKSKPFGPSPYWTAKVDLTLLGEKEKVNQKALLRLKGNFEPATDRIVLVEDYHGVVHMDKLDKARTLTIKEDGKGGFTLAALPLP